MSKREKAIQTVDLLSIGNVRGKIRRLWQQIGLTTNFMLASH